MGNECELLDSARWPLLFERNGRPMAVSSSDETSVFNTIDWTMVSSVYIAYASALSVSFALAQQKKPKQKKWISWCRICYSVFFFFLPVSPNHTICLFSIGPRGRSNGITATTKKLKSVDYLICLQNALPVGIQNKCRTFCQWVCVRVQCQPSSTGKKTCKKEMSTRHISWELFTLAMSTSEVFS